MWRCQNMRRKEFRRGRILRRKSLGMLAMKRQLKTIKRVSFEITANPPKRNREA